MKRYRQARYVDGRHLETQVVDLKNEESAPPGAVEVPGDTPQHGWGPARDSDFASIPFDPSQVAVNIPESLAAETREKPKQEPAPARTPEK